MRVFGITGGSGSGKTSVSSMLSDMGVEIIDTDVIAHEITEKGSKCLDELSGAFGSEVINEDGTLNRGKMAAIAFSSEDKTAVLNSITHKYIKKEVVRRIHKSKSELVGIDGAVIIGSNIEPLCEFIISVIADKEARRERIKKRDKITDEQVSRRLSAQPDDDFYRKHSKYILYNNSAEEELKKQVIKLYNKINEV